MAATATTTMLTPTQQRSYKYDNQVPSFISQKTLIQSPPTQFQQQQLSNKSSPKHITLSPAGGGARSPGVAALVTSSTLLNNNNADANDSSDDEVKDYISFKETFDEISHV